MGEFIENAYNWAEMAGKYARQARHAISYAPAAATGTYKVLQNAGKIIGAVNKAKRSVYSALGVSPPRRNPYGDPGFPPRASIGQRQQRAAINNMPPRTRTRTRTTGSTLSSRTGAVTSRTGQRFARRYIGRGNKRLTEAFKKQWIAFMGTNIKRHNDFVQLEWPYSTKLVTTIRMYQHTFNPTGGGSLESTYQDFNSFLEFYRSGGQNFATTPTTDSRYERITMNYNRHNPNLDPNQKVYLRPAKMLHQIKNNGGAVILGSVTVWKAKVDIPAGDATGGFSDLEPNALFEDYLGSDNSTTVNVTAANLFNTFQMHYSDANPMIKAYWKRVSYQKIRLEPGDEFYHKCVAPARTIDLNVLVRKHKSIGTFGAFMFKGELLIEFVWWGGLMHDETDKSDQGTQAYPVSDNKHGLDLRRFWELRGTVLPAAGMKFFHLSNNTVETPIDPISVSAAFTEDDHE